MVSKSHLNVFTGIFDMKGNPINNGSTIQVHDTGAKLRGDVPIIGKVIWKNGSYQFKGNHWCNYNIYAWRKNIEVIDTESTPVFESNTLDELYEEWSRKNMTFLTKERKLIEKAYKDGFIEGKINLKDKI